LVAQLAVTSQPLKERFSPARSTSNTNSSQIQRTSTPHDLSDNTKRNSLLKDLRRRLDSQTIEHHGG
jgi:hypothetical protein